MGVQTKAENISLSLVGRSLLFCYIIELCFVGKSINPCYMLIETVHLPKKWLYKRQHSFLFFEDKIQG